MMMLDWKPKAKISVSLTLRCWVWLLCFRMIVVYAVAVYILLSIGTAYKHRLDWVCLDNFELCWIIDHYKKLYSIGI